MNIVDWNGTAVDLDWPFSHVPEPEPLSDDPVMAQLQILHQQNLDRAQAALNQQFETGRWWTGGFAAMRRKQIDKLLEGK